MLVGFGLVTVTVEVGGLVYLVVSVDVDEVTVMVLVFTYCEQFSLDTSVDDDILTFVYVVVDESMMTDVVTRSPNVKVVVVKTV